MGSDCKLLTKDNEHRHFSTYPYQHNGFCIFIPETMFSDADSGRRDDLRLLWMHTATGAHEFIKLWYVTDIFQNVKAKMTSDRFRGLLVKPVIMMIIMTAALFSSSRDAAFIYDKLSLTTMFQHFVSSLRDW